MLAFSAVFYLVKTDQTGSCFILATPSNDDGLHQGLQHRHMDIGEHRFVYLRRRVFCIMYILYNMVLRSSSRI